MTGVKAEDKGLLAPNKILTDSASASGGPEYSELLFGIAAILRVMRGVPMQTFHMYITRFSDSRSSCGYR